MNPALLTRDVPGRLIAIGDIHGCHDELTDLLALVEPRAGDVVVSVGDMVRKGPNAAGCLELWLDRGYLAVLGNNEVTLLEHAHPLIRLFAGEDREIVRNKRLVNYIRSWPLVIDFPNINVAVVHGGFFPGMSVTEEEIEAHREEVVKLRWVRKKKKERLWSDLWKGERFVLYGHTPGREPRFSECALGLDTGCVYGGKLTAAILEDGEWATVSVPARRAYAK